jgi:hypothetical protein
LLGAVVRLDFYDINGNMVATHRHAAVCPTNDAPWIQLIDWTTPYTSPGWVSVRVSTSDRSGSGPWYLRHYVHLYP